MEGKLLMNAAYTGEFTPMRLIVALTLLILTAVAPAETHRFEQGVDGFAGFRDTTLLEDLPTHAGGGAMGVFSGTIRTGFLRRALIAVDLSAIPTDAVVVSARLEMTVERSGGNFGDVPYGLHRVARAWGEGEAGIPDEPGGLGAPAAAGDATWNDAFFTQAAWAAPGGDFEAIPSATTNAGQQGAEVIWEDAGLTADIQAWVANPADNFGWAIITPEEGTPQRVKKFFSSEAEASRPVLIVEVEDPAVVPPPPEEEEALPPFVWLLLLLLTQWWWNFIRG